MAVSTRCATCGFPISARVPTSQCPNCAAPVSRSVGQIINQITMTPEGFLLVIVTTFVLGTIFGPSLMSKAQRAI